ncbi:MAG: rhodanese-like domain-containing protein [Acidobacteriota bacterium]
MKSFVVIAIFGIAIALAAACSKAVSLPEYQKLQSEADVPRISVEDAKKDVDAGLAVIVDSRADSQYKAEHVAGSINVPLGSQVEKFSELPKDKKIIVYCS